MKKVVLGVLFLSMALFAKCDFSDGAVNSVADCPEVVCLPDAIEVVDGCCVYPKPVVIKTCCTSVCTTCTPVVIIAD